jgi:hypothetical protein
MKSQNPSFNFQMLESGTMEFSGTLGDGRLELS